MPKRGSIASCACAPCRKRKTRCDGSRPTCRACEQRRVECTYDVEEGITRTAALKSKLEQLELDYGSLVDLHSQLKNGRPDEVAALVNRIRAEDSLDSRAPLEPGSITNDSSQLDELESIEDGAGDANWDQVSPAPAGFGGVQQNLFEASSSYGGAGSEIPIDPALTGFDPQMEQYTQPNLSGFPQSSPAPMHFQQDPSLNMYGMSGSGSSTTVSARHLYSTHAQSILRSNLPVVRQGMALHCRSIPDVCSVYSEAQVENMIFEIEVHPDHEIPKARLCEMSSIAAVTAYYVRGHLQPGLIEFFYDAAKHFFEDCMQAPLPYLVPLKVCAMLALANILSKSSLAFVYIDIGLSLARNLDDANLSAPQHSHRPDYLEAKRVRRTLLNLRGYARDYGGLGLGGGKTMTG